MGEQLRPRSGSSFLTRVQELESDSEKAVATVHENLGGRSGRPLRSDQALI